MTKKIKHDVYLDALYQDILPHYDHIETNVPLYSKRNRLIGEVDIIAHKKGKWDVYEVKCSYRKTKARKQLTKIKKHLPFVANLFFFCGESGSLEKMAH